MVLNFNIIFLNELPKYQTQKHLKEKYGREIIYFGNHILIKQSVCPLEGAQWVEPLHGNVHVRSGEETQMSVSGRYTSRGSVAVFQ